MDETVCFVQPLNLELPLTTGIKVELEFALSAGIPNIIIRWLGKLSALMHDSQMTILRFEQEAFRDLHEFIAFSQELPWLEQQLWLSLAYTHWVLPHDSLAQELLMVALTRGTGSPRRWSPRTPAMAAGLTDHGWTTDKLLSYRVPATFIDQLDQLGHLFPQPESSYQGN